MKGGVSLKVGIAVACFAALLFPAGRGHAFVLNTSKTGGDCTKFGTWNSRTKTCTMNRDISSAESSIAYDPSFSTVIRVDTAGITLDGNGYALYKPQTTDADSPFVGIALKGKKNVTLRNLTVTGFLGGWGIYVVGTQKTPVSGFTATNMKFEGNYVGLHLVYVKSSLISGSTFGTDVATPGASNGIAINYGTAIIVRNNTFKNFGAAIELEIVSGGDFSGNSHLGGEVFCYSACSNNLFAGNSFTGSADHTQGGIQISSGAANTFRDNTFDFTRLDLSGAGGNVVYHNNFVSLWMQTCYYPTPDSGCVPLPVPITLPNLVSSFGVSAPNTLNMAAPDGGNYYNFYDDAAEGCVDANGDGFCDTAISFGEGSYATSTDARPFTRMNGWLP